MSTDDPRLEQALHDAAPQVSTADVVGAVTRRRARRRRKRQLGVGGLTLAVLLVVATVTVLVTGHDSSSPHVAAPGTGLEARVVAGGHAVGGDTGTRIAPAPVALDGQPGVLAGPVSVGASALSVASYDPGPGFTPSHVVRVHGDHVLDISSFKATVVRSIADGEGARWVLTQNHGSIGGAVPDSFLKRIGADGIPVSYPLPEGAEPVGPIAAVAGAVWVPVRNGVLQYSPTGALVGLTPLPSASRRWVAQVGKFAAVTDGSQLHGIDLALPPSDTVQFGAPILGLAAATSDSRVLLAAPGGGPEHARVARATSTGSNLEITATLPDGFVADGLAASPTRMWATGTVGGSPAIVLLGDTGVRATLVLENADPAAALAWTSERTVRAVSDGRLYEITLP